MDVDNMLTRACRLEATMPGYSSTAIDISDLNGFLSSTKELPPLLLSVRGADPRTINDSDSDVPANARTAWKAAVKGNNSGNLPELANQLKLVVAAAPKFARDWHTLGIACETLQSKQKGATRAEFVLGRILAAKGDAAGAHEHVAKYLKLNPTAPDADLIKGYLDVIGKPEAASVNSTLELP